MCIPATWEDFLCIFLCRIKHTINKLGGDFRGKRKKKSSLLHDIGGEYSTFIWLSILLGTETRRGEYK